MVKKEIVLKAEKREKGQKPESLKRPMPAILYGKGIESLPLWVEYQDFRKVYEETGESTIIDVAVAGNGEPHKVLIYDVQNDPISGDYHHADLFQVKMDEEITAQVALEFVGEAAAVKELGGVLVKNMDEIEVRSLPANLPGEIKVDVSALKTFDDYIYVKDLNIPDKVEVDLDPESVVALVSPPRSTEELESLDEKVEMDIQQVEGIKKEEEAGAAEGENQEKKE